ncbi:MAG: twin-arginine translocase TatA/TatE family subunit [Deltaproteobacteria bacterium]
MFGSIGPWELVLILAVALIVVGPGKLPEVARSMGKAAREFKKATSGVQQQFADALKEEQPSAVKPETVYETAKASNSDFVARIVDKEGEANQEVPTTSADVAEDTDKPE